MKIIISILVEDDKKVFYTIRQKTCGLLQSIIPARLGVG